MTLQLNLKNINDTTPNKKPVVYCLYKPLAICVDMAIHSNMVTILYIGFAEKGSLKDHLLQFYSDNENKIISCFCILKTQEYTSLKNAEQEAMRLISKYRPSYNKYYQWCLFD